MINCPICDEMQQELDFKRSCVRIDPRDRTQACPRRIADRRPRDFWGALASMSVLKLDWTRTRILGAPVYRARCEDITLEVVLEDQTELPLPRLDRSGA